MGLAGGVAVLLLVSAVAVATKGGGGPATAPTTLTRQVTTASSSSSSALPDVGSGTATTRKPTPLPIVAADDRRVVVLDQSGGPPPRTLFDLGPSSSSDQSPPLVGGVSLSGDARTAYFDVVGTGVPGSIRRVPVAGGPAVEVGDGVGPSASPDGSLLAVIQAPEPDTPAAVVLRPLSGRAERSIDLGDGTCGNLAWSPDRRELAVDICSGGEPVSVDVIDVATAGTRRLTPPDGVTWSVPAFKPDGTLTLVEQRGEDAFVVSLTPDRTKVAATILRRASASISTIDWSSAGDLVVCDNDAVVVAVIGGGPAQQVARGYTSAAW